MAGVEFGYDTTDGTIIGGNYATGKVFLGGRQQGKEITAADEHECLVKCRQIIEEMKSEAWYKPGKEDWEIRIWN
jgi:hypothetical protein